MKRREFLGTNMAALAGGALAASGADAADNQPDENAAIQSEISPDVQMQFMRPAQLEAAGRKFPVVYVPFGPIEWHGVHLPLGTDAIKAQGILPSALRSLVAWPTRRYTSTTDSRWNTSCP